VDLDRQAPPVDDDAHHLFGVTAALVSLALLARGSPLWRRLLLAGAAAALVAAVTLASL
jgi:hypothetical protein